MYFVENRKSVSYKDFFKKKKKIPFHSVVDSMSKALGAVGKSLPRKE